MLRVTGSAQRLSPFGFVLVAAAVLLPCPLRAQARKPGPALDPTTLPAHDSHQGLLIAVRPDVTEESSKAEFGQRNPYQAGVLGLDVYFRNDNDRPVEITLNTVQLFIGAPGQKQQKLDPISHDQVADLVLANSLKDPTARRRTPIPTVGLDSGHDKNWQRLDDSLRSASLSATIMRPHSIVHGYFYFDIDHRFAWLANARLDVPDVVFTDNNQALFFFDIDLAPAATN